MSVNDYGHDLYELIRELIDEGELEEGTPAYGIALYAVDFGYDALSAKRKFVYDRHVAPLIGQLVEQQNINARIYGAGD